MDRQIIILIMVVALVALAGVQAIQINNIKGDIADGSIGINGALTQGSAAAAPVRQAAPTMVGGC